ncbi:MAG: DUF885 domain-containing protein, partial [Acidimicrobiales bacterium]
MDTLDALIDDFVAHFYEESPAHATMHGIAGHDDRLPDLTAEGFDRRDEADDNFASRFGALDDDELTADERIDRDVVLAHLRGRAILRDWATWKREPERYLNPGLMGVFSLFLRRPHPEPDLARCAVDRLGQVPALLDAARANLDADLASGVMVERGLGQCRSAIRYCRQLVPAEVADDDLRADVAEAGEAAADAYEDFGTWLEEVGTRACGDWAIGEQRYSALLREKELLGFDAAGLRDRGRAAYDELDTEMGDVARAIQGADGDWRTVLDTLGENRPTTPEAMRRGYERCTEAARQFLVDHELVTLPEGESCEVVPSPPFQRPLLAVASYFMPPLFGDSRVGRFNVPYPPEDTPAEEVAQRLADNNYASMPTTSVHEAYPGHHWHYVTLQASARRVRRVITTPYFSEGWALYAERMMREQGFFAEPAHELCHLEARIFRAARIVVDTSLHIGDMTFEEAVTFMTT